MTAKLISSLSGQLSKAFPVLTVLNFSAQMGALPRKQQYVGALASLGAASRGPLCRESRSHKAPRVEIPGDKIKPKNLQFMRVYMC